VKREAMRAVREMLVQPKGMVVNATGERPFGVHWPEGTVLGAKTGSASDRSGCQVRWLVGHVGRRDRSWIFVSCVIGRADLAADALVDRDKFDYGKVDVLLSRTSQEVSRRVAKRRTRIKRRIIDNTYTRTIQARSRSHERSLSEVIIEATGNVATALDLSGKGRIEVGPTENCVARIINH